MQVRNTSAGIVVTSAPGENSSLNSTLLAIASNFDEVADVHIRLARIACSPLERATAEVAAEAAIAGMERFTLHARTAKPSSREGRETREAVATAPQRLNIRGQPIVDDVSGYGAVFHSYGDEGTQYRLGERLFERIDPGAFTRAIAERQDVVALFNHDPSWLLARRSAGTLRLSVDSVGLKYSFSANPSDAQHTSIVAKIKRGDLCGSSFAFTPRRQRFVRGTEYDLRIIEDCDLHDVSPVATPAYRASTCTA